ncbi:MAG: terpene cyclase/mutase family protein, partial [Pirellulales bacterium]|nr:terpene cyclase/mutase family protein [Pirellulales bacterium]
AEGLGAIPDVARERHVKFLLDAQQADGGFAGREGLSDLYYTSFALRGLAIGGTLHDAVAEQAGDFLGGQMDRQLSVVDFLSFLYSQKLLQAAAGVDILANASSEWVRKVEQLFDTCRREDGGYARGPDNPRSSTYHTFLILICLELLDLPVPQPEGTIDFLQSQQREDGGFVEFAPMRRSGTNPTAAAVGALRILHALAPTVAAASADFLAQMQTSEGGLRANTRIPIADLLSTFTGLLTLLELEEAGRIQLDPLAQFIAQLDNSRGGFIGALWDTDRDVEYTFYGMASLALLARAGHSFNPQKASQHDVR